MHHRQLIQRCWIPVPEEKSPRIVGWPTDIPWYQGIFNVFSLNLVCFEKPFCIDFNVSFFLFAGSLSKDERRKLWARNAEETTYGACDGPSSLWRYIGGIVVKLLKEDGEVWPKCGITEVHDGPS